jgi:dihydrofolate synthase/folylpolyglutamate synthase
MGGRDDATNIVTGTLVSVLTSISEDHLGMIGNDLSGIAHTKAGIIKKGSFVVSAPQKSEVLSVIQRQAESFGTEPVIVDRGDIRLKSLSLYGSEFSYKGLEGLKLNMGGEYQPENAAVAIEVCSCLKKAAYHISEEDIRLGLGEAVCPFRLERILEDPEFILDGAHNPGAAEGLYNTLLPLRDNISITLIMGMFKDKDYRRVTELLTPLSKAVITVSSPNRERTLSSFELAETIRNYNPNVSAADSPEEAVELARLMAGKTGVILACGSLSILKGIKDAATDFKNKKDFHGVRFNDR